MVKKTTKTDNIAREIKKTAEELISKLNVAAKVEVVESDDHYKVNIDTEETGLLIGRHGETINSLQLILGVIFYRKFKKWTRIVVDVGDYREAREQNIKDMVGRIAAEVETTLQPVILPPLTPLERRIVHLTLSDNPKITSESTGEGKERRVVIKPRAVS